MSKALGWHSSALDADDRLAAMHLTEAMLATFAGLCGPFSAAPHCPTNHRTSACRPRSERDMPAGFGEHMPRWRPE